MSLSSSKFTLFLLILLVAVGAPGAHATPVEDATLGIKRPNDSFFSKFDFSLEWTARTDFNEPASPQAFEHMVQLTVSKDFLDRYTVFLTGGVEFTTMNNSVYRTNVNDDYFSATDATLGGVANYSLNDRNNLTLTGTEDILLSTDSRYFGYLSVTGVDGILGTRVVGKWLRLMQSADINYIWNRYRYAPVTSGSITVGDINPDAIFDYAVGPYFTILPGLNLGMTVSVRAIHYLDNSDLYGFGNAFTLTYSQKDWSVRLKYINRGYADRGETDLWFADSYRRLTWAGLVYNF